MFLAGSGTASESGVFVYQNGQIVLQFDGTGNDDLDYEDLSHRYLWGPTVDFLLADEQIDWGDTYADGEILWAVGDHLGTPRDWVDNDGEVVDHAIYDSFGNRQNVSAIGAAFDWTGRWCDPITGLQYNDARWYNPSIQRWMSEDRIWDGTNRQVYVGNAPTMFVDPSGLENQFPIIVNPITGTPYEFWMPPQGSRQLDNSTGNRYATLLNKDFQSAGGTWHHADFDPNNGFLMQLVEREPHGAQGHTGGFAKYCDWVADSVQNGDLSKLTTQQISAITEALRNPETMKQLGPRLSKLGIKATMKEGELVLEQGGHRLAALKRLKVAGRWVGRLTAGLSVFFVIQAAADAKAAGGSDAEAAAAAIREMTDAAVWEAGFQLTVVSGCEVVGTHFIPPISRRPKARQLWPDLTPGQRLELIKHYSHEIGDDIEKRYATK